MSNIPQSNQFQPSSSYLQPQYQNQPQGPSFQPYQTQPQSASNTPVQIVKYIDQYTTVVPGTTSNLPANFPQNGSIYPQQPSFPQSGSNYPQPHPQSASNYPSNNLFPNQMPVQQGNPTYQGTQPSFHQGAPHQGPQSQVVYQGAQTPSYTESQTQIYQGNLGSAIQTNVTTQPSVKGESRIEYVPYERTITEYEEVIRQVQVPVTSYVTDYQAIQYDTEYIPQTIQEKVIEYVAVERIQERIEYQAVTNQTIIHTPNFEQQQQINVLTTQTTQQYYPQQQQITTQHTQYPPQMTQQYQPQQQITTQSTQYFPPQQQVPTHSIQPQHLSQQNITHQQPQPALQVHTHQPQHQQPQHPTQHTQFPPHTMTTSLPQHQPQQQHPSQYAPRMTQTQQQPVVGPPQMNGYHPHPNQPIYNQQPNFTPLSTHPPQHPQNESPQLPQASQPGKNYSSTATQKSRQEPKKEKNFLDRLFE